MIDHRRRNGQLEEYSLLIEKLESILKELPRRLKAIDGRPSLDKTTLGRCLAWLFNVSSIETDHFLIEGEGNYRHNLVEILRIVKIRQRMDRPVIVEGAQVFRQLDQTSLKADFVIYLENA